MNTKDVEGFESEDKLFVGGINFNTTEDTLKELFSRHGKIRELKLIRDRETGKSKGFAFIQYVDKNAAFTSKMALNGFELEGRKLGIKWAIEKKKQ